MNKTIGRFERKINNLARISFEHSSLCTLYISLQLHFHCLDRGSDTIVFFYILNTYINDNGTLIQKMKIVKKKKTKCIYHLI